MLLEQIQLVSQRLIRHRCNSTQGNHGTILSKKSRAIQPLPLIVISQRNFKLSGGLGNNRKDFSERKILGYSMEELFNIVAEVEKYKHFVPYCLNSVVTSQTSAKRFTADLTIGFPPLLVENYTASFMLTSPTLVKSVYIRGNLFNHLETIWKFSPGPSGDPKSCTFDFYMSFEFRSLLHTQLSQMFFDNVVNKITDAFSVEAKRRYGPPSITNEYV
ncbi:hypothetical protein DAPPUDRAFT_219494 [Daphnia pulex]|uniref:Coenzyme Q-binding protein COQ10 START domain-containing protein n=1 Tax=Daphnia pulex TaxID=6669 RepID=E9HTS8_DAPPU|nr:hypothetical protein DAPPUDRAFT_219494 [Daphnia pulex]|eukprot:EFX64857.1 hypothetical protein DAPPUDRAFT_219494 [Daphnia pulex]